MIHGAENEACDEQEANALIEIYKSVTNTNETDAAIIFGATSVHQDKAFRNVLAKNIKKYEDINKCLTSFFFEPQICVLEVMYYKVKESLEESPWLKIKKIIQTGFTK